MTSKLDDFKAEVEVVWNIKDSLRLMGWDQQIMMPAKAAAARSRQMATLSRVAHERLTHDDFRRRLETAEQAVEGLDHEHDDHCLVRLVRRHYDRAVDLPADLVEELTQTCALAFDAWVRAKADSNFSAFAPHFKKVLALKQRVAEQRGYQDHPYDAMLDDYEPGMTTAQVRSLFEGFRPQLVELVKSIAASDAVSANGPLDQDFAIELQDAFSRTLAESIGYDLPNGRIDPGPHPFCASPAGTDVRLTNRFTPGNLCTAMFGTLHEAGHGIYEQFSPPRFEHSPLRGGCSLGVHESQSRMWENFVGRSRPFWSYHFPRLQALFPEQLSGYEAEDFYRAVNRVRPSFIRVEADEVTYTLHIIMRFEMETALMDGTLAVDDVPECWNAKMEDYLGVRPASDRVGCLQDIHWSDGLIGYFPTYSIGNMIAAQMWERMEREIPELDERMARGDTSHVLNWLRREVYDHASKFLPNELVRRATGHALGYEAFGRYLEKKYTDIYRLKS
ncbi:MAG: carboxypeptidase M32 [Candidatus Eremiobacteraeota bacterium]|nr:carboxypeptidase M32 [Candidatus Eremiobacteraeota bacterium]